MRTTRSAIALAGAVALLAMLAAGVTGAAASGPLFDPPVRVDAGLDGPWMPGFPVRDLDGDGRLDLALLGCEQNQSANVTGCPDPQPTLAIMRGDGAGGFTVVQQLHAGSFPTDVTAAQLDNDGRLDLAVTEPFAPASTARGEVLLYAQQSAGGAIYRLARRVTLAGPQPKGTQAADLNGDGAQDLVVLESDPAGPDIQVLLGDPSGNFNVQPQPAFGSCASAHFFKGFTDFNEDGRLDFAVPCVGDRKIAVMLGNGDGSFSQQDIPFPGLSMSLAQADMNGDGHRDLVFSARGAGATNVAVLLGSGTGSFAPAPGSPYNIGYSAGNLFTTFLDVADLGGPDGPGADGIPDVAVVTSAVNFSGSSVSILLGQRDGSLVNAAAHGSPIELGAGTGFATWGLVAGDWNGDGRPDLAVAGGATAVTPGRLTLLTAPRAAAASAAPGTVPAAPVPLPAPAEVAKLPAKLAIARARIVRSRRLLDVLAPITSRAAGRVAVELYAAARRYRFSAPIDSTDGRIRIRRRIPAAQARLGTGILTIRYGGDADTRPQTVRLRAASQPAALLLDGRPRLVDGRLRAAGAISPRARGVVRLQLQYDELGVTRLVRLRARIAGGRWTIDAQLPQAVLAGIAARVGTLHSYVLFTGYMPARMRGEMRSFQVLGAL